MSLYEEGLVIGLREGTLPSKDAPSTLNHSGGGTGGGGGGGNGKGGGEGNLVGEHEKEWKKIQGVVKREEKARQQKKKEIMNEERGRQGKENQQQPLVLGMPSTSSFEFSLIFSLFYIFPFRCCWKQETFY